MSGRRNYESTQLQLIVILEPGRGIEDAFLNCLLCQQRSSPVSCYEVQHFAGDRNQHLATDAHEIDRENGMEQMPKGSSSPCSASGLRRANSQLVDRHTLPAIDATLLQSHSTLPRCICDHQLSFPRKHFSFELVEGAARVRLIR